MKIFFLIFGHLPLTTLSIYFFYLLHDFDIYIIISCLLFGWLIDIDHLIDYFLFILKTKNQFNLKEFLSGKYFHKSKRIIIFLHSYEISISILIISIFIDERIIFVCLAHTLHLLQDHMHNRIKFLSYFFLYRAIVQFNSDDICSD